MSEWVRGNRPDEEGEYWIWTTTGEGQPWQAAVIGYYYNGEWESFDAGTITHHMNRRVKQPGRPKMNKNCIINCAVREPYECWSKNLKQTAEEWSDKCDFIQWVGEFPPGAKTHHQSLYGFKWHAFDYAFQKGYKNVLWLDSPCSVLSDPTPIFEQIERDGHYFVRDEDRLWRWIDDNTLLHYGKDQFPDASTHRSLLREQDWRLFSGTFVGLRSDTTFLNSMLEAEGYGLFMDAEQDCYYNTHARPEGVNGHRHDESVLSLLFQNESVWQRESHFQSENAIVRTHHKRAV
jgi:hypothetical protein